MGAVAFGMQMGPLDSIRGGDCYLILSFDTGDIGAFENVES